MYFTDSPFERLMLEKPGFESKNVDAAWNKYEKKMKKRQEAAERSAASRFISKEMSGQTYEGREKLEPV